MLEVVRQQNPHQEQPELVDLYMYLGCAINTNNGNKRVIRGYAKTRQEVPAEIRKYQNYRNRLHNFQIVPVTALEFHRCSNRMVLTVLGNNFLLL